MKLYFNLSGFGTTVGIARLSKSGGGSPVASSATEEKEKRAKLNTSHLQRDGFCLFTVSPMPVLPSSCQEALATQKSTNSSREISIPMARKLVESPNLSQARVHSSPIEIIP